MQAWAARCPGAARLAPAPALAVAGAALALYAPELARLPIYWQNPAHSHGPLVLLASCALFVQTWRRAARRAPARPAPWAGVAALLLPALALLALGRLSATVQFSLLGLPLLLAALALWAGGPARLRAQGRFAYFFLLFLVPWPAVLTDPLTQPLKLLISVAAEQLLHGLGYPVARDGVVLQLGAYQLHVADACSGLHSLFMLEAFGLLYLHLLRQPSAVRQATLAALILPISFTANLLRVLALALLTFHGGSALGQGLLHEGSGLLLFTLALLLLAPADTLLRRFAPDRPTEAPAPPCPAGPITRPGWTQAAPLLLALACVQLAVQHASALPPGASHIDLQQHLPPQVGGWRLVAGGPDQVVLIGPGEADVYDQQVLRTYADPSGRLLMLNISHVSQVGVLADTAHDPALCYVGQGFQLLALQPAPVAGVPGHRLLARRGGRLEAASYWLRTGARYDDGPLSARLHLLRDRLAGHANDGLLARASVLLKHPDEAPEAHAALEDFLATLVSSSPAGARALLQP
ncbi:exosortase C-terminal domain/associated protein EpsI [Roseateles sp. LKC17W]|uniref:Exosortase C-terminal domain/associated protein EpsI n=1 Tax=Pelomonas margarita TaxID=3299031 RepID=A0ABW7FPJ3_9BURK